MSFCQVGAKPVKATWKATALGLSAALLQADARSEPQAESGWQRRQRCGGALHRSADCLSDFTSVLYQTTFQRATTRQLLTGFFWCDFTCVNVLYFQYIQDVAFKMRYSPYGKKEHLLWQIDWWYKYKINYLLWKRYNITSSQWVQS